MTTAMALLFGVFVGLILGSLGGGGSVLVVPALVYGLSVPPFEATTLSQVIVGATSLTAAMVHLRAGRMQLGTAAALVLLGAPGAYLGRLACDRATGAVIMICLATTLIATSILMLRNSRQPMIEPIDTMPNTPPQIVSQYRLLVLLGGVSVGFLTGFLGVGGGFLILPLLVIVLRVPMKPAIGTSLAVIAGNCASSLIWSDLTELHWDLALPFTATAIVASAVVALVVESIDSRKLAQAFAWLVILIGVVIYTEIAVDWAGHVSKV